MANWAGVFSLVGDRDTYRPRTLARSVKRLRQSPFLRREVWRQLRDYNRPDFHPDDRETAALIETWRTELFGDAGSLTDLLPRSAA